MALLSTGSIGAGRRPAIPPENKCAPPAPPSPAPSCWGTGHPAALPGGSRTLAYAQKLHSVMDAILTEVDMDVCAIVVPDLYGFVINWHRKSKLAMPAYEQFELSRLFQSPMSKDGREFLLSAGTVFANDALVKGANKLELYVECPVKGASGRSVLATICLADRKLQKAPAGTLDVLKRHAKQVAAAIHFRHQEANDLMMPHTAVLECDWIPADYSNSQNWAGLQSLSRQVGGS
eukprot:gb/GFBE01067945.1/.p1 GENE.gb/GFBE01067945.1/~~gb/GFBE01067945.1/.p1  ORF type:complete len:234 (+),score=34.90 gb/GFBE01067945.1/:1-702(+)